MPARVGTSRSFRDCCLTTEVFWEGVIDFCWVWTVMVGLGQTTGLGTGYSFITGFAGWGLGFGYSIGFTTGFGAG